MATLSSSEKQWLLRLPEKKEHCLTEDGQAVAQSLEN